MAKPQFQRGDRLPDLKASDMQDMADRAWQSSNLLPGPGIDILDTPFARTIQLADQFDEITTQNQRRFWAVVIETTAIDIKVRQVDFRLMPAVSGIVDTGQPGQIRAEEYRFRGPAIPALPNFGTRIVEYDDFIWEPADPTDPKPTVDDTFLQVRWEGGYWVVEPPVQKPTTIQSVVVRSIGLDVDNFLQVQNVKPELDAAGGWTGGYVLDGAEWEVAVHPYAQAGDYRGFIWAADRLNETTPVLRAYREFGMWTLDQYFRFEVPELSRDLLFNDCTPNLIGGP